MSEIPFGLGNYRLLYEMEYLGAIISDETVYAERSRYLLQIPRN